MKTTTRQHYRQRLLKVMDYIHQNLERDLDVNALAEVAMMSPYHFHRIYREMAKETVNGTVRRLRLQQAAVCLIRDSTPIAAIARHFLYGSVEAFSRAFSQQFGRVC
ncbi:MAG: AraC family transcriptional regulator [Cellvibrionaceae bacterium]|nr:AraC family transcriptional regulator [Cellvibrionaceae bacterium]